MERSSTFKRLKNSEKRLLAAQTPTEARAALEVIFHSQADGTLYLFIFFSPPGTEPRLKSQPDLIMLKQMVQSIAGTCFRELLLSCLSPRGRPAITSCARRLIFIDTHVHAHTHTHSHTLGAGVPAGEHSRPCRRDSCAGPSRPRPPSGRCAARGPSSSPCRVCGRARCARSWSRAAPPRCRHTARPASEGKEILV